MKYRVIAAGLLGAAMFSGAAFAADITEEQIEERISGAAVSEINGKIEFGYVHIDIDTPALDDSVDGGFVQGAVSVPVGQQFGLQIDAAHADLNGSTMQGIGGHFFWRDPSVALLGIYGHHIDLDNGFSTSQIGAEVEIYNGEVSLELFAGQDSLDTPIGDADFFVGEAILGYYINDNFRVSGGIRHSFDETTGVAGLEIMSDTGGIAPALFANAEFGGDVTTVMGGLKFYFGSSSKSLKRRHREDDPDVDLIENGGAALGCGAIVEAEADAAPMFGEVAEMWVPYGPPTQNGCGAEQGAPIMMMGYDAEEDE